MFTTRRRFVTFGSSLLASSGLLPAVPALAARSDDDDGPPNVFFSPHGRPYRAPSHAPYPIGAWFKDADRDGDGKLDQAEFVADAAAFFDVLDVNGDGVLSAGEISLYEHAIAPEVLGMRVSVYASGLGRARPDGARLWLAQYGSMEGPISDNGGQNNSGAPGTPGHGGDPNQGAVLPDDVQPNNPNSPQDLDAGAGAAPFSLMGEPEPVTASDPDYLFHGVVKKASFLAHARDNFARLDSENSGYLTLAGLPQTSVERLLGHRRRG